MLIACTIIFAVFVLLCVLSVVCFCIAGRKCEDARDEIDFGNNSFL
ncbi:hypothetical protein ACFFP0_24710 [Rhizobium puerariae]|uniref:P6 n=1 Tax=Rhizobium puerariae TaxID=1585791 RepID=A0ABV6AQR5_9HYPH